MWYCKDCEKYYELPEEIIYTVNKKGNFGKPKKFRCTCGSYNIKWVPAEDENSTSNPKTKYIDIQNAAIQKYNITTSRLCACGKKYGDKGFVAVPHVHIEERAVCRWEQKNSAVKTFDLFCGIGHILNNKDTVINSMNRYDHFWAFKQCTKLGILIPGSVVPVILESPFKPTHKAIVIQILDECFKVTPIEYNKPERKVKNKWYCENCGRNYDFPNKIWYHDKKNEIANGFDGEPESCFCKCKKEIYWTGKISKRNRKGKWIDIQNEVISKYKIKTSSDCILSKTEKDGYGPELHVHIENRYVCNWKQEDSFKSTMDLLVGIGCIENHIRFAERKRTQKYYATLWALQCCASLGILVPAEEIRERLDIREARIADAIVWETGSYWSLRLDKVNEI